MPNILKHTLILPDGDSKLAAKLLDEAIKDLDYVLMLVFGHDGDQEEYVRWADKLAARAKVTEEECLRHVVWVRKPHVAAVRTVLDEVLEEGDDPLIVVLSFHDEEKARFMEGDKVTPVRLLNAFAKGHRS